MGSPSGTVYEATVGGNKKELSRRTWLQGPSGKWDAPTLQWLTKKDSDKKEIYKKGEEKKAKNMKKKTTNPIFAQLEAPVADNELTPGPLVATMISQPGQERP